MISTYYMLTLNTSGKVETFWLKDVMPSEYLLYTIESLNNIDPDSSIPDFPAIVFCDKITEEEFLAACKVDEEAPSLHSGVNIVTSACLDSEEDFIDDDGGDCGDTI